MESIIQDLGEIPDEYLEPAGDGGYNTDPENDETTNEYQNSNFGFSYDCLLYTSDAADEP